MNERYLALLILILVVGGFLYQDGRWRGFLPVSIFNDVPSLKPLTQQEFEQINNFKIENNDLSTRDYIIAGVSGDSSQAEIYRYSRTVESQATSSILIIRSGCITEPPALRASLGGGIVIRNFDSMSHTIRINAEDFLLASGTSSLVSGLFSSHAGIFSYYCDARKRGVVLTVPIE